MVGTRSVRVKCELSCPADRIQLFQSTALRGLPGVDGQCTWSYSPRQMPQFRLQLTIDATDEDAAWDIWRQCMAIVGLPPETRPDRYETHHITTVRFAGQPTGWTTLSLSPPAPERAALTYRYEWPMLQPSEFQLNYDPLRFPVVDWLGLTNAVRGEPEDPAANERAANLLKSVLTEAEWAEWEAKGYVTIPSALHQRRTYRVEGYDVKQYQRTRYKGWYCLQAKESGIPRLDKVTARVLLLKSDEQRFLDTANYFPQ